MHPPKNAAFSLIELLVVVGVVAVLAAIAVPNMLEAQVRAKISRAKADMRALAVAIESYGVDHGDYPIAWGLQVEGRDSLQSLSTPVAYMASGDVEDPFAKSNRSRYESVLLYEDVNDEGRMIESPPQSKYSAPPDGAPIKWWWIASRGPDQGFGFGAPVQDPEGNLWKKFYKCDLDPGAWLTVVYDPTNGSVSLGNIYRAGGAVRGFAGQTMR